MLQRLAMCNIYIEYREDLEQQFVRYSYDLSTLTCMIRLSGKYHSHHFGIQSPSHTKTTFKQKTRIALTLERNITKTLWSVIHLSETFILENIFVVCTCYK